MLISCEKCSTTYVLDDKLIPPQGAPVQCTRCQHVFTARPPGAAVAAASEPQAATNRTQMFGAPGAGAAPPQTSKTVMFGAGGSDAPAAAPTNRTMMFGAPGSDAPGPGAAAAANKTMMFGAPGTGAAPPPAGGTPREQANKTMMFGVPGSEAAPGAAAAAQPTNRTMMFGAPGAAEAQPTNKTMMFGAPGSDTPPAAAANKTMMFGAPGSEGAPPAQANPRSTMMFGAVPPSNLGSVPPTQAPAQQKTSSTMMFGTAAVQPPAQQPAGQQKTSTTMMFGTPAAVQPPPAAAPSPAAQKSSSTMIFGATPVTGPGPGKAPKLTESTVRIGPEDLERMMREHEALGRGEGGLTPPEAPAVSPAQDRQNKTQMFAMSDQPDGATPPGGNDAVARQNKTQMFAMTEQPEVTEPAGGAMGNRRPPRPLATDAGRAKSLDDASILDTFPPDAQPPRRATDPSGVHTLLEPGGHAHDADSARAARPASSTLQQPAHVPNATAVEDSGGRLDLPPEAPDLLKSASTSSSGATQPVSPVDADPAAVLRAQVARRNRIALILIALVLVAAAVGVTVKVFLPKLMAMRAPPAAAVEGVERALAQLRFDDDKSKEAAVTQLNQLVTTYPDYIEGHAALVTAVSLQLDDVQQRVRRIEQLVERKNSLIARYNREKSPANWETLATRLSAEVDELIKEHKPLSEEGHALDTKAREAYKGLDAAVSRVGDPTKQAKLAAVRAQALFHGVSGTDQALVLTKRYETLADGAQPDGWIDLAIPEYAANARVSEELMAQAMAKLEELHKRDSTFLRTYVLSARLHLIKKELEAATTDLDQVLTMRKEHDVATELREWVRKLPKTDDKEKKDP